MRLRVSLAVLLVSILAFAQGTLTVTEIVKFVRSSIQLKQPDKEVAKYLSKLKLTQRLDDRTIEQLEGEGAGPKTVAALHDLRDATSTLPAAEPVKAPIPPKPIPPPSYEEQQRILSEVRDYALNYSKTLPDYICTQVTRRYADPYGSESWRLLDTLTIKLTYFEQKENYKLTLVNNQMVTDRAYESVGGAISSGEFGSMLRMIFDPATEAEFHWDRWGTLRGHRSHVYAYHVEQPHSQWLVDYEHGAAKLYPAYKGLVFVDAKTNQVLRITFEAVDIPATFPVQQATTRLDYDYIDISGHQFLLPMLAEMRMRHDRLQIKNDEEFRLYRKFSADSTLTFDTDTPAPLSDDKTREEPVK